MLLTNKHFIISLIVAPILAVIAYFGVDAYVSEKPHKARKGESYPLVAKSNCRYKSGKCTLENGDISVSLSPTRSSNQALINFELTSDLPLQGVKIALATQNDSQQAPLSMEPNNTEKTKWKSTIIQQDTIAEDTRLQIALSVNDTVYYGETEATFTTYQTSFSQDNIKQH